MPNVSAARRRAVLAAALAVLASSVPWSCARSGLRQDPAAADAFAAKPRPNLLLILPDEWQGRILGCMGDPDVLTPNTDALAAEGVVYENAFSNVPQCSPARALLLTSRFPSTTGVLANDLPIRTDVVSLARVLGAAGYRCGYIGKWHLNGWRGKLYTPPGAERLGFDDFWAANSAWHSPFEGFYFRDTDEQVPITGYEPETQTDLAVGFMEDHLAAGRAEQGGGSGDDRPFFLMVSYGPPHTPHESPERFQDQYDPATLALPPNATDSDREERALYLAAVTAIDHEIGRLTDALARLGAGEHTLTVVASDHGAMLGAHGLEGKQVPFDEAVRIPLVMRMPGVVPAGVRRPTLISLADLLPTLLGLLDVDAPRGLQGADLAWDARGEAGPGAGGDAPPESVFLAEMLGFGGIVDYDIFTWRAVRTAGHLYAEDRAGPWLLYDMSEDPWQLRNRVDDPSLADLRDELRAQLRGWERRAALPHLPARAMAQQVGVLPEVEALIEHFLQHEDHEDEESVGDLQRVKIFDTVLTRSNRAY